MRHKGVRRAALHLRQVQNSQNSRSGRRKPEQRHKGVPARRADPLCRDWGPLRPLSISHWMLWRTAKRTSPALGRHKGVPEVPTCGGRGEELFRLRKRHKGVPGSAPLPWLRRPFRSAGIRRASATNTAAWPWSRPAPLPGGPQSAGRGTPPAGSCPARRLPYPSCSRAWTSLPPWSGITAMSWALCSTCSVKPGISRVGRSRFSPGTISTAATTCRVSATQVSKVWRLAGFRRARPSRPQAGRSRRVTRIDP